MERRSKHGPVPKYPLPELSDDGLRPLINAEGAKHGLFYDVGGFVPGIRADGRVNPGKPVWQDDPPQLMWREHCVTEAWARAKGWLD